MAGLKLGEIIAIEASGDHRKPPMCYMTSREGNLGDSQGHWQPHLTFDGRRSDGTDWGSNLPGSPVMLNPQFQTSPEPLATFMVAVDRWSDGTSGPIHGH